MDGVAILEHEVRELIRRRGLDPVRDRPGVVALGHGRDRRLRRAVRASVRSRRWSTRWPRTRRSSTRSPGSARCSSTSTTRRSRRSGSTRPTQVFVARRGEAELTTTILTDGQVRDLVEQMLKVVRPPPRPVQPVRRRQPARRGAAARGDPRRHAAALVGEHPQVRGARDDARRPRRARLADPARGRVPAGVGARRAQRARLGRDPGRQDHDAQRPGRRHPARASGSSRARRSSSCGSSHRDWVAHAVPPAQPRGHGRDPAAPAGQGGAAHAPEPAARRRGARGRGARPAHRPERRRAGDVHHPRELGARGADQALHAAAARRARTCRTGSWCRRSPRRSTSSCTSTSTHAGGAWCARSSRCPAGSSRAIVETADVFHARDGHLVRADGYPPHPERFARTGIDLAALLRRAEADGGRRRAAARGRAGVHLVVVLGRARGSRRGARSAGWHARTQDALVQAGVAGVTPGGLVADERRCSGWSSWCSARALTRIPSIALCFAVFAGDRRPGRSCAGGRAAGAPRLRQLWPEVVDHLGSGIRAGLSLPEAVAQIGERGPVELRAGVHGVRRGLPGDRAVRRVPRRAQGAARRPGGGPDRRGAAADPRRRRHRPRPAAAHAVDVPARGRAHARRAGGAAELDRLRRPARGRRAVDRPRAAGHPPGGRERVRHPGRVRRARRRRRVHGRRVPSSCCASRGCPTTRGCCGEPRGGRRARRAARRARPGDRRAAAARRAGSRLDQRLAPVPAPAADGVRAAARTRRARTVRRRSSGSSPR